MSRVKKLRAGAALVGVTAMALLSSVAPAAATDGVTGKLDESKNQNGYGIIISGFEKPMPTKLFGFTVGDSTLNTYCVDVHTPVVTKDHPGYVETGWDKHPQEGSSFNKNSAFINWVLHKGFPATDLEKLEKASGAKDKLTKEEAITGTQAALWTYSDDVKINRENPVPDNKDSAADVLAVYDYLTGKDNVGIGAAPKPVLTLDPAKLTGKPDSLIGPFVVTTSASDVSIAAKLPDGVILSDKDGKELKKADVATKIQQLDKYEFYVKVPANIATGKVEFSIAGQSEFSLGRLFVTQDAKKKTQSMILATSKTVKLDANGVAEWASAPAAPQPKKANNELANTGASILTPILIGVVLVGAGVGALVFQRRRRA
ncbi:TQXA domain-containing protein/LPXTG-motif cell wall-anchored protein [Kibdelosporangium banguiense]|uniref:TQXA domain-containing protein/LPXTG-motif cell wall-anchored protein n=1 Tax=Kibdelosporangium banguiense TaxID=1365924 RepID=A0ABS4TCJ8_9PSEU|nr:thioester domain-containing protein [Kibdelosporangium banguiense]MBP2321566.1 TQXA domain-containing protein/LPXTG-motif cell wall-anchored protein [Kibdelosporangium banguiense]